MKSIIFARRELVFMKTSAIERETQDHAVMQIRDSLVGAGISRLKAGEDEFDRDLQRAISGDELVSRLSKRLDKMFENASALPSRS